VTKSLDLDHKAEIIRLTIDRTKKGVAGASSCNNGIGWYCRDNDCILSLHNCFLKKFTW